MDPGLAEVLNFETEHTGTLPKGWGGGPPNTIFVDGKNVHGGRWSVRLERNESSPETFSTIPAEQIQRMAKGTPRQ